MSAFVLFRRVPRQVSTIPFERSAAKLKHDASDDDGGGGGIEANETIPADLPGIDEELLSLPKPPLLSAREESSRRWTSCR